jgi:serine/threonine protein kinase
VLAVGSLIGGRFRIDQILGAGGMGIVVAATHLELGHRVAIKLLRDEMAQSPTLVERFLREARSVVGLRTEHVCKVTDIGRLDTGTPFIVMELLEGVDLQHVVHKQPLPVTTAVEYVLQACVALAEAHAAGIIHRDLKPANLFVTRRLDGGPLVKVLDFGIAKALADTGAHLTHQSAMGSPGYMSPEQIQSARDVDVRTDLWALGVTLYQLLSSRMPFPAASHTEIAIKVATEPPAPLDVDPALRAVIWKCL